MIRKTALVLLCALLANTAHAEGMADSTYTSTLLELNRIRPDQNPGLKSGAAQLEARLLDKNQRTLGRVEDIIVTPEGKFKDIITRIDTAGFREKVAFDVESYVTTPTPDTFTVSLDKTQIKQNIAKLRAAARIELTENGPFSVVSLRNGLIYKVDGSQIAKVKDVLIDGKKLKIVSLLLTITFGDKRDATIAVPYEAAMARLQGSRAILTVTDAQAEVISSMATRKY